MFLIRNSANLTTIDIIGSIGEDWFDEGNSLETVRGQIVDDSDLEINISSLGGDLIEALAVHDMFKAHKGKVTTNIIGATASAGTVIALGGDYIRISENSLFLGHKASMMVGGNAEDLRAAADDLDKFDSRLINIYKKKTGKTKAEIEAWLIKDSWLTAEEAKAFGVVDEVYKAKKVLNSAELEELSKIHELPQNFNKMEDKTTLTEKILNAVGFRNDETIKAENETLKAKITDLESKVTEIKNAADLTTEIETLKGEVTNKVTELDSLKAELETAKTDIQNKATEIERLKANGIVTNTVTDPNPTGEPRKLSQAEQEMVNILNSVTPAERALYSPIK